MKKTLKLLLISSILGNMAGALYAPIAVIFIQKIGGDILSIGYVSAIYFAVIGIFIYIFGLLSDKFGKKRLLVMGFLTLFFGDLFFILIRNISMLFIGQIILGIGLAMTNPSWNGLFSKSIDKGKESTFWGAWEFFVSLGISISAILGASIVNFFGFSFLFFSKAMLHLISAILSFKLEEEKND
jgi:MFS family permease